MQCLLNLVPSFYPSIFEIQCEVKKIFSQMEFKSATIIFRMSQLCHVAVITQDEELNTSLHVYSAKYNSIIEKIKFKLIKRILLPIQWINLKDYTISYSINIPLKMYLFFNRISYLINVQSTSVHYLLIGIENSFSLCCEAYEAFKCNLIILMINILDILI